MDRREMLLGLAIAVGGPAAAAAASATPMAVQEAFLRGFPVFEFARTGWSAASRTGYNKVTHRRALLDPSARNVTAPNNDTLYSSARLDLTAGPVWVNAPDMRGSRYASIAFMDAQTNNFAYIGTRTTGGRGGRYWVVGPTWRGRLPEGVGLLRSPTMDAWLLGRFLVANSADLDAVHRLQDGLKVRTAVDAVAPGPGFAAPPSRAEDPQSFLDVVNTMIARSPKALRALRQPSLGLSGRAGEWRRLPPELQETWGLVSRKLLSELAAGLGQGPVRRGWRLPPTGMGSAAADPATRAFVALTGLAAMESEEATYMFALADSAGAPLTGEGAYVLRLPEAPPVDAFWSLSMYALEPDGRMFFASNPIGRYAIGDRTPGLVRDANGGIVLRMQHEAPAEQGSWLPSPRGPWTVAFRAYLPRPEILDGRWALPPLERIA